MEEHAARMGMTNKHYTTISKALAGFGAVELTSLGTTCYCIRNTGSRKDYPMGVEQHEV
jgi:hypothetical protein